MLRNKKIVKSSTFVPKNNFLSLNLYFFDLNIANIIIS